ncbi:TetR/AcrR family transcriptional regulator [Acetanaerobacterium elongatum]|uniref:Transcriptional regulator, TetR family n=1 Tax=Acetanaerobacterium elongatum TaxID=258515 RepID=A0A1G9UGL8_9FIRM|nr:TetR/AcrR family transcriptional regulator [Acetanaerobacterium elongatum]SDM59100.1 transcriptional regulator, TetR family [Acetanaerobacterium elongatum]
MTTKERILEEALNLFSVKGYEAVSVRDIAGVVGIRESAIYKHYPNKRAIYDCILTRYAERMSGFFQRFQITDEQGGFSVNNEVQRLFEGYTEEQLIANSLQVFRFVFTDETMVKVRRMLTVERYCSTEAAALFCRMMFDDAITYQSQILKRMIDDGLFVKVDPEVLAWEFYAPIFSLFFRYDNGEAELNKALILVEKHIRHFYRTSVIRPL